MAYAFARAANLRRFFGCSFASSDLATCRIALAKSEPVSATAGAPSVDAERDGPARRHLEADLDVERALDLALLHPDLEFARLRTKRTPRRGEREQLERLHREAHVLQRRHVEAAEHQQLVGPVERGQHRPVEEGRGVDDDDVVRLPRHLEQAGQLRLVTSLVLGRSGAGRMSSPHVLRRSPRASRSRARPGDDEVVDGLLGLESEHDRGVAELQVEVEQERALLLVLGERRRFVAVTVFPVPPFGENTVTIRPWRP